MTRLELTEEELRELESAIEVAMDIDEKVNDDDPMEGFEKTQRTRRRILRKIRRIKPKG